MSEEVIENLKYTESSEKENASHSHNTSLELIDCDFAPIKFNFKKSYTDGNGTHTLSQTFGVNIGYYAASDGKDNYTNGSNSPAGAYLLKPKRHQEFQYQYSQRRIKECDYQHNNALDLHQWTFDFHNANYSESAMLRVTYEPKHSETIQFDLELNGINIADDVGKDVIINWKFDDFEDGEQFWTDSNGLEM